GDGEILAGHGDLEHARLVVELALRAGEPFDARGIERRWLGRGLDVGGRGGSLRRRRFDLLARDDTARDHEEGSPHDKPYSLAIEATTVRPRSAVRNLCDNLGGAPLPGRTIMLRPVALALLSLVACHSG